MTATPLDSFPLAPSAERLLPWREVKALAGISRTTAWRLQNAGRFPRPVEISPGRVGWRAGEVDAWRSGLSPRKAAPAAAPPVRQALRSPPSRPAPEPTPRETGDKSLPRRPRRQAVADPAQMSFDF